MVWVVRSHTFVSLGPSKGDLCIRKLPPGSLSTVPRPTASAFLGQKGRFSGPSGTDTPWSETQSVIRRDESVKARNEEMVGGKRWG